MKITRYAMMLAAATGLLSACQKLDEVKAYDPDKVVAPVLHALPGEIVITPDNMGSTQTFTWDAADFGVRTQINYSIEASYNDGAKLVLFTGMNGTSSEQTYESLNNILALSVEDGGLGVPSGEPTDVDFYISATIGTDFEKFYSAPATVRDDGRAYLSPGLGNRRLLRLEFRQRTGTVLFLRRRGHLRSYR